MKKVKKKGKRKNKREWGKGKEVRSVFREGMSESLPHQKSLHHKQESNGPFGRKKRIRK